MNHVESVEWYALGKHKPDMLPSILGNKIKI